MESSPKLLENENGFHFAYSKCQPLFMWIVRQIGTEMKPELEGNGSQVLLAVISDKPVSNSKLHYRKQSKNTGIRKQSIIWLKKKTLKPELSYKSVGIISLMNGIDFLPKDAGLQGADLTNFSSLHSLLAHWVKFVIKSFIEANFNLRELSQGTYISSKNTIFNKATTREVLKILRWKSLTKATGARSALKFDRSWIDSTNSFTFGQK